jgi:hypothetical protein
LSRKAEVRHRSQIESGRYETGRLKSDFNVETELRAETYRWALAGSGGMPESMSHEPPQQTGDARSSRRPAEKDVQDRRKSVHRETVAITKQFEYLILRQNSFAKYVLVQRSGVLLWHRYARLETWLYGSVRISVFEADC